jgi:hypothetical protein
LRKKDTRPSVWKKRPTGKPPAMQADMQADVDLAFPTARENIIATA